MNLVRSFAWLATAVACVLVVGGLQTAPQSDAGGCFTRTYVAAQAVHYQAPVAYAVPVLAIPSYSAGYVGDAASARELADTREALRETLRIMRSLAVQPPQAPQPQYQIPQPLPPGPPQTQPLPQPSFSPAPNVSPAAGEPLALFMGKCARCHDASTAAEKGDGVVLTQNGQIVDLDCYSINAVLFECLEGKMPRGGPKLTGAELRTLVLWSRTALVSARDRDKAKQPPVPQQAPPAAKAEPTGLYRLLLSE